MAKRKINVRSNFTDIEAEWVDLQIYSKGKLFLFTSFSQ